MPEKKNRRIPRSTNKKTAGRKPRTTAKQKIRDSVFTSLFGEPKYSLQLYQALHPEDETMTQDAIRIVTLENMLMNRMYNDLGFKAGDRLLILVESQSQWSENILVRILLYAAQTIQDDIAEKEENVYGSRKIALPEMEFYMIYVGTDREEKPSYIRLSESFYEGKESAIDLKVRVLYGENEGEEEGLCEA